jgi:hypothetical protein
MDAIGRQFMAECGHLGVLIKKGAQTSRVSGLLYADDLVLLTHDVPTLRHMLTCWDRLAATFGLITSTDKTKAMAFGGKDDVVEVRGKQIKFVTEFRYLGCIVTADLDWGKEVESRLRSAQHNWQRDKVSVFMNRRLPLQTRVRHFRVTVLVALLYGAECWTLTAAQSTHLAAAYHCFIRQMLNIYWWHHRSTNDILYMARLPPFTRLLASRTIRWYGHVHRMDPARLTAAAFDIKVAAPICTKCGFETVAFAFCPMTGEGHLPQRTSFCAFKTWEKHVQEAITTAVEHFPFRYVPDWDAIIGDRAAWRVFSSAFDATTSWDSGQRRAFLTKHRNGVGDRYDGPPTGPRALLKVYD